MYNKIVSKRSKRPYRKRKRAESEEETRRRITEAAVELHGTVGPANTTVTELAERAGVSRMTVYNHFPGDADLLAACSSHWASQNPFPDPQSWETIAEPAERLERALTELYAWYDQGHEMLANVLRDAPLLPALSELMDDFWGGYMNAVVSTLATGWPGGPSDQPVRAVMLRVVVDFNTWQLLSASGLDDAEAAALATTMVARGADVA